jgi:hypothetical protein
MFKFVTEWLGGLAYPLVNTLTSFWWNCACLFVVEVRVTLLGALRYVGGYFFHGGQTPHWPAVARYPFIIAQPIDL